MPTVVFSSLDAAGINIKENLLLLGFDERGKGEWERNGIRMVEVGERLVNANITFETDLLIFASRHRSETAQPCLTAHVPGNWGAADLGGKPRTLCPAPACAFKSLLQSLARSAKEENFGWPVQAEVTHHGPYLTTPALFIEIGSSEIDWKNEKAGKAVARAIVDFLDSGAKKCEVALGAGGGHYAPSFTKILLETDVAVGHMIPKHALDKLDKEMFGQALEKTVEKVEFLLLDWKGMIGPQREKLIAFAEEKGLPNKRTKDLTHA